IPDSERLVFAPQRSRHVWTWTDGAQRRCAQFVDHRAIQPTVVSCFQTGRTRFHVVLSVEVRAGWIRRPYGFHNRELLFVPERFERTQGGMETEMTLEIDRRFLGSIRSWNSDRRAKRIVRRLAVRNDDVQAVHRTALEDYDQDPFTGCRSFFRVKSAPEPTRHRSHSEHR